MSREDARLATLSKEYQAMYGKENARDEPAQATRPVPRYLLPVGIPDGWIFDNGSGTPPMLIYDYHAANILMAENPQYRVRPFIFLKTEI